MATYPSIVYGVPYVPEPPPESPKRPGRNRWFGWDGSVVDMGDRAEGVIFADGGASGLGEEPPFVHHRTKSPALAGSRYRGTSTEERPVDANVLIWSDVNSAGWLERDRAFAKAFCRPDKTVVWEHTTPAGEVRYLTIRFESREHVSRERGDAHKAAWALYQMQYTAEDPYWHGAEEVRSWSSTAEAPEPWLDPDGSPPFHISQAAGTVDQADIPNPGDVDAWPIWTFIGPLTDLSVSFNGGTLDVPDVASGQTLVVNTDPRVATATRNGADVMGLVDTWDPRPIPSGGQAPVAINMTGTGVVRVTLVPRYYRAY